MDFYTVINFNLKYVSSESNTAKYEFCTNSNDSYEDREHNQDNNYINSIQEVEIKVNDQTYYSTKNLINPTLRNAGIQFNDVKTSSFNENFVNDLAGTVVYDAEGSLDDLFNEKLILIAKKLIAKLVEEKDTFDRFSKLVFECINKYYKPGPSISNSISNAANSHIGFVKQIEINKLWNIKEKLGLVSGSTNVSGKTNNGNLSSNVGSSILAVSSHNSALYSVPGSPDEPNYKHMSDLSISEKIKVISDVSNPAIENNYNSSGIIANQSNLIDKPKGKTLETCQGVKSSNSISTPYEEKDRDGNTNSQSNNNNNNVTAKTAKNNEFYPDLVKYSPDSISDNYPDSNSIKFTNSSPQDNNDKAKFISKNNISSTKFEDIKEIGNKANSVEYRHDLDIQKRVVDIQNNGPLLGSKQRLNKHIHPQIYRITRAATENMTPTDLALDPDLPRPLSSLSTPLHHPQNIPYQPSQLHRSAAIASAATNGNNDTAPWIKSILTSAHLRFIIKHMLQVIVMLGNSKSRRSIFSHVVDKILSYLSSIGCCKDDFIFIVDVSVYVLSKCVTHTSNSIKSEGNKNSNNSSSSKLNDVGEGQNTHSANIDKSTSNNNYSNASESGPVYDEINFSEGIKSDTNNNAGICSSYSEFKAVGSFLTISDLNAIGISNGSKEFSLVLGGVKLIVAKLYK
ncbi:hypothetical protein AYI69_g11039 [Smittium culicis]|uniref:Uncharacterized protein n=1 Tax=Smittium culicis TaxID=133412 RepID=A0A1R1X1K6_9FUNG|nr:hypothetical protein AYI69_g11039 [Smittium culicis]